MRFRGKSIRRKIVALLLVPLLSLGALWAFATVLTGREAARLLDATVVSRTVGTPVEEAVDLLQRERRDTLVYLADRRAADAQPAMQARRDASDTAIAAVRAGAADPSVRDAMTRSTGRRLSAFLDALDGIAALRRSVDSNALSRMQALGYYNRLIDPAHTFLVTAHVLDDAELERQGRALVGLLRGREMLSREDALIASTLTTGRVSAPELRALTDLMAQRTLHYRISLESLSGREGRIVEEYWSSPRSAPLRDAEDRLVARGPAKDLPAVEAERWEQAAVPVLDDLAAEAREAGQRHHDRVEPAAYRVLARAGVAGVLGFLALLASVIVSVRIGRELVRALSRLRKDAHEVAAVRLPSVMRRLAAGEQIDVETEAPRLEYGKDEIGQVGQALNTLQRAAVEAAVRQADMRRGVSEVFVNLARRNQVLLHRQLTLLDAMERRTEDTEELADLFRLDHLTTRMRRHAEGLVILSGAAPSRQWRKPIQLMDVVRAAVAEVEDYERIEVRRLPRIGVGGPAVADLTHLIAELLENATVFSPPHTGVQVLGERVANGFTLEIHDRGLGMTPEALLDANLRLAETPEFELSDTDRLGLFVVSRLARRQNVRVSLQRSPYGGTTAVVFIPAALLTDAPETRGTGFRLDRKTDSAAGRREQRRRALSDVPPDDGPSALLDGPVELEAPVGALGPDDRRTRPSTAADGPGGSGFDEAALAGIEDTEGERGGIFRARAQRRAEESGRRRPPVPDTPLLGAVPLPRRRPPTLVADHGRRVDDRGSAGRHHPVDADGRYTGGAPIPLLPQRRGRERGADASADASADAPGEAPRGGPSGPRPLPAAQTTGPGGLPRRVRQASLVPQLRRAADTERPEPSAPPEPLQERDAEAVRARMASIQRGWRRGRRENDEGTGGPDAPRDGRGPATTDAAGRNAGTQSGPGASPAAPGPTTEGDGP
ncbi:nitrate- and nitrite sensing domain-containing protein [Streptomyces sp. NPDC090029]|uniref:sensor histidine kinase n=1 Tax=Streptomyces sp. NPDC090029 TaxID=3365924 RepID=UPI0038012AC8